MRIKRTQQNKNFVAFRVRLQGVSSKKGIYTEFVSDICFYSSLINGATLMKRYLDCPQILRDFLTYHETIKGQSQLTVHEYYLDLRMFLRFVKLMRYDMPIATRLDDIPIKDIDLDFISGITTSDVFDFL